MSQLLYGSLDFSELLKLAKEGNKAFSKSEKNGKIYLNIQVWINDEKDKFDNDASVQTVFKDATKEERIYIGNLKKSEKREPVPLTENDSDIPDETDLPF